jgi:hypothetical protein
MKKAVIGFKKGPLGAAGYERRWLLVLAALIVSRQVNVFMLTTENTPNMKERGKALEVEGWIVKGDRLRSGPISQRCLLALSLKVLKALVILNA